MDRKEFLEFYEQLLKAQLSVVRQFSGQGGERRRVTGKGRSQVGVAEDILQAAEQPLHVTEIIRRAKEEFDITIDRESLVSALTKKVKKGDLFVRVAPNTFSLAAKLEQ